MKEQNSLHAFLASHSEKEKASFHMPGHKGSALFVRFGYGDLVGYENCAAGGDLAGRAADYDITEIPGADDLRHADSVIKAVSDRYSELYGSRRSFLSVNGSSALIMAAVMSQVKKGHKIIAASDSHISVKNGIELAGAEAVYVDPVTLDTEKVFGGTGEASGSEDEPAAEGQRFAAPCQIYNGKEPGIPGGINAEDIGSLLDSNEDADAVILPSPNYFGIVSDIRKIAEEVHKRGRVLIVDQAHGAHLKMFDNAGLSEEENAGFTIPAPAENCGADIVIDSTHKTMASFTQSAVANIYGDRVDPDSYEQALLKLESTSPSYLLMDSLAVNADIMEEHGNELARAWRDDLDYFYDEASSIDGIRILRREFVKEADPCSDLDESKIVIDFSRLGMTGEQAEEAMIEKGVYPEFNTGSIVMCLTGIGNVRADYEALFDALKDIAGRRQADR